MDSRSPTAFCADLRRRVMECQKFATPLTLMLLDIDDFKPVVEHLGNSARDMVVTTMSEFLTMSLHDIDVVSHYGDGHFAIMMPGTELSGAIKMAERLRTVMAGCSLPVPRRGIPLHAQSRPGSSPIVRRSPLAGQACRRMARCWPRRAMAATASTRTTASVAIQSHRSWPPAKRPPEPTGSKVHTRCEQSPRKSWGLFSCAHRSGRALPRLFEWIPPREPRRFTRRRTAVAKDRLQIH